MQRRKFIQNSSMVAAGFLIAKNSLFAQNSILSINPDALNSDGLNPANRLSNLKFPVVRIPESERKFKSTAVENVIKKVKTKLNNTEVAWLFENCFPNTLDTTVDFEIIDGKPDTYVITGDIDAMWLRDSTAQVWPYLPLMKDDPALKQLIKGVINRQTKCILKDPYANAFYKDESKVSEWKETDLTEMLPGIHERKWEIDSLCYPIRLAYNYWKHTGDTNLFDARWKDALALIVKTFKQQQRKTDKGPYSFQRTTNWATDGVPMSGFGYPIKPVGLICSMFRPSDDATIFPFLIPSNFFAVVSLRQAAEMANAILKDAQLANECTGLANEVETALKQYAIIKHPQIGEVYAYEVNGFGSFNLMDDANIPSLLSLPYLGAVTTNNPIYQNTRKLVLGEYNPFYYKGKTGGGIGSPHTWPEYIWHLGIIMRAMTSTDQKEINDCIEHLRKTHGNTGFMHESFHVDDPTKFTRKWFAWANTLFGELIMKVYNI
jgi:meiotically up-regulated gene 157 (Mug157) protein